VRVEGAVVDLAEGEAVRDLGAPALVAVGENVGGIEQLHVVEAAHRAALPVGAHHQLPEAVLVETTPKTLPVCWLRCIKSTPKVGVGG